MTAVALPGLGYSIASLGPYIPNTGAAAGLRMSPAISGAATSTIDAAAEKFTMIGRVTNANRSGSKTISAAGGGALVWATASVTFNNGSTSLDVGIQDVSGNDPDGTFDVKATLVGGTDTIGSSAIITTAMETGTKTINHGDLIAIVWDLTAKGGADSVIVAGHTPANSNTPFPFCAINTSGSWSAAAVLPNILIRYDDGSHGWITPFSFRGAGSSSVTFNSGTATFDEYGGRFVLPIPITLEAIQIPLTIAGNSSDFELCIYSDIAGTPTLVGGGAFATVDVSEYQGTSEGYTTVVPATPLDLAAGTYGWTVRPTTANNVTLGHLDYGANANMASLPFGIESYRIKRLNNTGAFTLEDSLHMPFVLFASQMDNGAGGGGAGPFSRIRSGM